MIFFGGQLLSDVYPCVVGTNKCLLHVESHNGYAHVTSIIDNLTKGASGQAVENMNLMFGLERTAGLRFKANYY